MYVEWPERFPELFTRTECLRCGYLLTGLPREGICPECGQPYAARNTSIVLYGRLVFGPSWTAWVRHVFQILALVLLVVVVSWQLTSLFRIASSGNLIRLYGLAVIVVVIELVRGTGPRPFRVMLSPEAWSVSCSVHHPLAKNPAWGWLSAIGLVAIPFLWFGPPSCVELLVWMFVGAAFVQSRLLPGMRCAGVPTRPIREVLRRGDWRQLVSDYQRYRAALAAGLPNPWTAPSGLRFDWHDDHHARVTITHGQVSVLFWAFLPMDLVVEIPPGQLPALQICVNEWTDLAEQNAAWASAKASRVARRGPAGRQEVG